LYFGFFFVHTPFLQKLFQSFKFFDPFHFAPPAPLLRGFVISQGYLHNHTQNGINARHLRKQSMQGE